jgi:hypothetical protein
MTLPLVRGQRRIGSAHWLAARNEVLVPDASRHPGKRKCIQSPAHVPALIAIGEPAYKNTIECGARDDAKLAEL